MIRFIRGNLFDSKAVALVNTVNCVGVMGKGIAYQFKRSFPLMFEDYAARCSRGEVRLGEVTHFHERGKTIINFPTKNHWRSASRIEDISAGLDALHRLIIHEQLPSVAIPPLGCGNGGLNWTKVKDTITSKLTNLRFTQIEIYEPVGQFESVVAREPKLSLSHFILATLRVGLKRPTKLGIQKAAYFFNIFSRTEFFRFTEYKFGPYCVAIDPMYNAIRDYLSFTGMNAEQMAQDGWARKLPGPEAARLQAWAPAINAAISLCNQVGDQIEAVATTHAIIAREGTTTREQLVRDFFNWSAEKSKHFSAQDVFDAAELLKKQGLIHATLWGFEITSPRPQANTHNTPPT
ncbi:macro domain-containing protein [Myxococcus sp. AM009]|uniref:type II toxin-antitoxin system antitoxin DNA ADP-ribosyl glycohydrolase DarG n=1 Tax=Myxococcus sp. AM009 TaxID=2745137 RepID=UPI00159547AF|nr:macro domain-containing protein [Myxococcus sp. AM009]NVJ01051.1 macro domain-containing protein [Myxococcus sp. AM009]